MITTEANSLPDAQRIAIARTALLAATSVRGVSPAIADDAVIELLADLRHFCIARRIDFRHCNAVAEAHFEVEIARGTS